MTPQTTKERARLRRSRLLMVVSFVASLGANRSALADLENGSRASSSSVTGASDPRGAAPVEPTVLVTASIPSALVAHIESELALAGMRAARHVTSHDVSPADLSQAAQSEGARAVLRVQSEGIEVWLFDPSQPSGRRLSFVELVPASLGGDAILALRASEIARAAVIVEPPAAAVAPVAARDDGARDPRVNDAPPLPRWHGSAGPLALFAGGQSTAMPMLAAHVGYALSPSFRLEIGGAIPLAGALIERADGNAALTVHEVFGDVLVDLFPSSGAGFRLTFSAAERSSPSRPKAT